MPQVRMFFASQFAILQFDWDVDMDTKNLDFAKRNILSNSLRSRIRPLQIKNHVDPLIPLDAVKLERYNGDTCSAHSGADILQH